MTMRRCIYVGAVAAFASSAIINAAPTEDASVAARDDYSETSYGSFFLEKRGDDDDKDDTTEDLLKGELEPPKRKEWKGKKERRIDWDDVGLKTGGKGDNTPVDPEDPASAVQAKRSLEDFSLETRAPGLSPIVSTAALRGQS